MHSKSAVVWLTLNIIIYSTHCGAAPLCPDRSNHYGYDPYQKCDAAEICSLKSNKYYYDPDQDEAMMSVDEDLCTLPMATLRTILRGLVAVLTQIFPECAVCEAATSAHRNVKKEEPIKIFRQIMSCPPVPIPYYPCYTPPRTQIPAPPTMPTIMHTSV